MDTTKQYYKHKYGGIYMMVSEAKNKSDNDNIVIVYQHVYPFGHNMFVKNKEDFINSNVLLTFDQLAIELAKPQKEFQDEINARKQNK